MQPTRATIVCRARARRGESIKAMQGRRVPFAFHREPEALSHGGMAARSGWLRRPGTDRHDRPPSSSDRGISATSCSDRRHRAAVLRAIPHYVGLLSVPDARAADRHRFGVADGGRLVPVRAQHAAGPEGVRARRDGSRLAVFARHGAPASPIHRSVRATRSMSATMAISCGGTDGASLLRTTVRTVAPSRMRTAV